MHQEAVDATEKYLTFDPNDSIAYLSLALSYSQLGRQEDSMKAAYQSIKLDPKNAAAYSVLGLSYRVLGNHEEAIKAFRMSIKLGPDFGPSPYCLLADSFAAIGKYQEAKSAYEQALEIDPNNASAYAGIAAAHAECSDFKKAIEYQRKAIGLGDDEVRAEYEKRLAAYKANKPWRQ
ncbi:hypothetical protein ES703_81558 [subsurface metagenome]